MENNNSNALLSVLTREGVLIKVSVSYFRGCKKLKPEEVEGSTFTVTNPGQFGAVFGLPIINQPNSAILGVGGITKMPLVVTDADGNDSIAIRSVVHLTLGYDHRLIDGAVADQFMAFVKKTLEGWSEEVG